MAITKEQYEALRKAFDAGERVEITFCSPTRYTGARKARRVVRGYWDNDGGSYAYVKVNYATWNGFMVKTHEIQEIHFIDQEGV